MEVDTYMQNRSSCLVLLASEEEKAIENYALWQVDQRMPLLTKQMKALMCEIYCKDMERGEKRQPMDLENGPSKDFMVGFKVTS